MWCPFNRWGVHITLWSFSACGVHVMWCPFNRWGVHITLWSFSACGVHIIWYPFNVHFIWYSCLACDFHITWWSFRACGVHITWWSFRACDIHITWWSYQASSVLIFMWSFQASGVHIAWFTFIITFFLCLCQACKVNFYIFWCSLKTSGIYTLSWDHRSYFRSQVVNGFSSLFHSYTPEVLMHVEHVSA